MTMTWGTRNIDIAKDICRSHTSRVHVHGGRARRRRRGVRMVVLGCVILYFVPFGKISVNMFLFPLFGRDVVQALIQHG
jgi:hypothetical protein